MMNEAKQTTLGEQLDKAIANNEKYCRRILAGPINEADAVYLAELTDQPALTDREIYIYHRAFGNAVKAVRAMVADAENLNDRDLSAELFAK